MAPSPASLASNWSRAEGSGGFLVSASAWTLGVTARVIHPGETPDGIVESLVKRLGVPTVRLATRQAMRLLGSHFVLGQTIEEALSRAGSHREFRYSFDMLGEGARTAADASRYLDAYAGAIAAIGRPDVIATLRTAGAPYAVAAPSVALALQQLAEGDELLETHVARVRDERAALCARLTALGLAPLPSQANFILAECGTLAPFLTAALAALGVVVRDFPNRPGLIGAIRITLPGDAIAFQRLVAAFETVLAPEALLFDLDGVLADVQHSQRAAIAATASSFGAPVTPVQVATAIRSGNAANDWLVTRRLIEAAGVDASLADVTARYQSLYLDLREKEQLIPSSSLLERLAARLPLALVTGRPRAEAEWFLDRAGIASFFKAVVAMEDARAKPDPAPVRLALERLGVRRAWLIGDTPDDVRCAKQAGVLPLGVVAPGDDPSLAGAALRDAGAACVCDRLSDLLELLP